MALTLKALFDKCREKWGLNSQILMLAEECSELSVASLHVLRNKHISTISESKKTLLAFAEEIADVEFMLAEMKYYFKNVLLIAKFRKEKERRLEAQLK